MYGHVKDALKDVRDTVNEGFNIHRGGEDEEKRWRKGGGMKKHAAMRRVTKFEGMPRIAELTERRFHRLRSNE